jgi:adenylate kinase family enzyme
LVPTDRLVVVQRVTIVGGSGSGKSTLAAELAERLDAELIELDAIFHKPDWTATPTPQFRAEVAEALDSERWVVAGNYSVVMDLTQGGADTIVWLDLPRWLVTWRVVKRSIRRAATREELWNGNRARWGNLIKRDPEDNIIVWAWTHHAAHTQRYETFSAGNFWAHADVHRLRSPQDVSRFLSSASLGESEID